MNASRLRIATIGTWGHLGDPIAEFRGMPDAAIVAHARATGDDDVAVVRKLCGDDSIPWFDDYHQMLGQIRPDVVIVSTRVDRINSIAIDAANAGCHLICEKPLAISHEDLRRLHEVTVAKRVQCIAMLGNARQPTFQAAARLIASGSAGDVVLINARKSYKWGERPQWFGKRETYGGSILWIALHALEMIHLLSGQEFVSVAAMQSNCVHPDRPGCEDNGVLLLQLSGGGHASASFDLLRPNGAATHGDDWVRVVCSRGVIEASPDRGWCKFISEHAPEVELPLPQRGEYYAPFVRRIATSGGKPLPEMVRSFMLTRVGLIARDAADSQRTEIIGDDR